MAPEELIAGRVEKRVNKFMVEREAKQTGLFIFFLIFLAILQIGLRLIISDSLELDEAEQILYYQEGFQWGYNTQPPLYNWLQIGFFHLFGLNIFALTLLKSLLIAYIYFMIYRCALLVLNHNFFALLSSLSLWFVYDFNWILQKDLTHTVMLLAVSASVLYVFLKILKQGKAKDYFLFGVLSALGLLSKNNFFLFLVVLLSAAFSIREFRGLVWNKRMVLALAVGAGLLLPHVIWFIDNPLKSMVDIQALNIDQEKSSMGGILTLLLGIVYFLLQTAGCYLIFCPAGFRKGTMANRELELLKLFWERFYLIGFALIVSLILLFHIVLVHSRWFLPFLFMIPSYYFLRHLSFPLSPLRSKAIVSFAVFGALVMTLAVPGRIFVAEARGKFGRLNYPMADISNKIKAEGFQRGLIIAQDHLLGADLKLNFQDSFVITPVSRMRFFPQGTHEKVLVIWEDSGDTEIPSDIRSLSSHLDIDLSRVKVTRLATPYKYGKNYNYKVVIAMTQTNNGF